MTEFELLQWELTDLLSELYCARLAGEDENSKSMLDLKEQISLLKIRLEELRPHINIKKTDEPVL